MRIFIFMVCFFCSNSLFAVSVSTTNLNNILFTSMNFVYIEAQGTIRDNFEEERSLITSHVLQYGITTKRTAILFLDDYGTDITYSKDYNKNEKDYSELLLSKGVTTSKALKFEVTEKYLTDNFGQGYLDINRKVLVGVLLFPNVSITPTQEIKTVKFSNMTLPTFQAVLPLSENDIPYTQYDKIYDRTSMIKYINLEPSRYIGMLEIFDEDNQAITFVALKGNKSEFIKENGIRGLIPGLTKK